MWRDYARNPGVGREDDGSGIDPGRGRQQASNLVVFPVGGRQARPRHRDHSLGRDFWSLNLQGGQTEQGPCGLEMRIWAVTDGMDIS